MHLLRFIRARLGFALEAAYLPGAANQLADAISRDPMAARPIPLVDQQPDWTSPTWSQLFSNCFPPARLNGCTDPGQLDIYGFVLSIYLLLFQFLNVLCAILLHVYSMMVWQGVLLKLIFPEFGIRRSLWACPDVVDATIRVRH